MLINLHQLDIDFELFLHADYTQHTGSCIKHQVYELTDIHEKFGGFPNTYCLENTIIHQLWWTADQINFEESRLISLLQEGSEYAFQLIYDKYRNRIYQTAINFLKSPIIAQDVVQDVFMKLWFERNKIDASKPVEAWLYTVAKNNILNNIK